RDYEYRFPAIEPSFTSGFHSIRNLELSGGGPWRRLMSRVVAGHKPMALFSASAVRHPVDGWRGDGDLRAAARFALSHDLNLHHELWTPDDGCTGDTARLLTVCVQGRIGELCDLDALRRDYREYLAVAGKHGSSALREIERELLYLERKQVSHFLGLDGVGSDCSPAGYVRSGLLLGYPPETTAAIILGNVLMLPRYGSTL
ncbi:MAG: hypothetical protein QOG33_2643, partial [Gaiellales bacterium]|nr:hypothetical protein [Gaiellales bacterium]